VSDAPKRLWFSDECASILDVTPPDPDEHNRYTLTSGAEWDALMHEIRVQRERCKSDGTESTLVRILAYFGEQP